MYFPIAYSGEIISATSATRCPDVPLRYVAFKAAASNTGKIYVGGAGVTKVNGTGDATTGWPLAAGESSPVFPVANLNSFYYIGDNATDSFVYTGVGT